LADQREAQVVVEEEVLKQEQKRKRVLEVCARILPQNTKAEAGAGVLRVLRTRGRRSSK
jgi:hypothetical protein